MNKPTRWSVIKPRLKEAREKGMLGVVAASTSIAEYRLHDVAKLDSAPGRTMMTAREIVKLYEYFKSRPDTR